MPTGWWLTKRSRCGRWTGIGWSRDSTRWPRPVPPDSVELKSGQERLQMTFAALGRGVMQESRGMPSQPQRQTTIFRWMATAATHENLHVVALNPGRQKLGLAVRKERGGTYLIEVTGPGRRQQQIHLKRPVTTPVRR